MKVRRPKTYLWWALGLSLLVVCTLVFFLPFFLKTDYKVLSEGAENTSTTSVPTFVPTHVDTPNPLKAIYMTACVASSKTARERLAGLIDKTELNSIVIDIKDYSG